MRFSYEKKAICWTKLGLLIAVLLLGNRISPLFAATKQSASSDPLLSLLPALRAEHAGPSLQPFPGLGGPGPRLGTHQKNTQLVRGNVLEKTSIYQGRNQGNDGNQGVNAGNSQDNSTNVGNLVTNQRRNIASQVNAQRVIQGNGGTGTTNTFSLGTDQGNTGNEGLNLGNNQDNSGNSGNQVNNQGNVIGTQVNAPGADVNNDGSIIEHQVNHMSWLPPLRLQARLLPNPQLALRIGG